MPKPWSKLKTQIEGLWPADLGLGIRCTTYPYNAHGSTVRVSRYWMTLGKVIVWDFPGPFLYDDRKRGGPVEYVHRGYSNGGSVISELLREYLDRERDRLFEPFEADCWECVDMLRAADRRIGRERLEAWSNGLDEAHPAWAVMSRRFGMAPAG